MFQGGIMKNLIKSIKLFTYINVFEKLLFRRQIRELYFVLGGHIHFQTLSAANRLGVFDIIHKHKCVTRKELAALLKIEEQPCRILLLGLTTSKLLKKKGEQYYNSKLTEIYLVSTSPKTLKNVVDWQHFINYRAMPYFYESILQNTNVGLKEFPGEGNTLYERLASHPELENIFQLAMEDISRQANIQLLENLDLKNSQFAVDIGGGAGENITKLVKLNAHLKGGVFDSPTVAAMARLNFKKQGLENRLMAFEGNCFEDPLPSGPDCFILCHFLTIWSLEKNYRLIKKVYDTLPDGGKLAIFNMMQSDNETGPMSASMGSPYFLTLATGEGMLYCWKEYIELIHRAGFKKVDVTKLPMHHGLIVAQK
jgi:SAM-dependent methyltransferase